MASEYAVSSRAQADILQALGLVKTAGKWDAIKSFANKADIHATEGLGRAANWAFSGHPITGWGSFASEIGRSSVFGQPLDMYRHFQKVRAENGGQGGLGRTYLDFAKQMYLPQAAHAETVPSFKALGRTLAEGAGPHAAGTTLTPDALSSLTGHGAVPVQRTIPGRIWDRLRGTPSASESLPLHAAIGRNLAQPLGEHAAGTKITPEMFQGLAAHPNVSVKTPFLGKAVQYGLTALPLAQSATDLYGAATRGPEHRYGDLAAGLAGMAAAPITGHLGLAGAPVHMALHRAAYNLGHRLDPEAPPSDYAPPYNIPLHASRALRSRTRLEPDLRAADASYTLPQGTS